MVESYQTNLLNVASSYVKKLNVPVTITSLKHSLKRTLITRAYFLSAMRLKDSIFPMWHLV